MNGRERLHETDSEGSVSCGGELTADAERVYSRKCGRQRFSFEEGSMDWRRCTPEWSCRRILKLDGRTIAILTNTTVRQEAFE